MARPSGTKSCRDSPPGSDGGGGHRQLRTSAARQVAQQVGVIGLLAGGVDRHVPVIVDLQILVHQIGVCIAHHQLRGAAEHLGQLHLGHLGGRPITS